MSSDSFPSSPLSRQLEESELDLLLIIWSTVGDAETLKITPEWPSWDYVRRIFAQSHPEQTDATEVLAGLPTITAAYDRSAPYGLFFASATIGGRPEYQSRIGLTIAGLSALARSRGLRTPVHDHLVKTIQRIAKSERGASPIPTGVVDETRPLKAYVQWAVGDEVPPRDQVPIDVIAQILQREYPSIATNPLGMQSQVTLRGMSLVGYETISNAADYLDHVSREWQASQSAPFPAEYLPLAQTLDYLGYVLNDHPNWSEARLTSAIKLEATASLHLGAGTREEFESRLNGLWSIVDSLVVPAIPKEILRKQFAGQTPRSIARLEYWMGRQLDNEQQDRAAQAFTIIRLVGRLRAAGAHPSSSMHKELVTVQRRLGLTAYSSDWSAALSLVKAHLAAAFDAIRVEVQAATQP